MAGAVEESTSKRAAVANRIFLLPRVKPHPQGANVRKGPVGVTDQGFSTIHTPYYGKVMKNLREILEREA